MVLVGGEISSSKPSIDYQEVVRGVIKHIGYDDSSKGSITVGLLVQCSVQSAALPSRYFKITFYHLGFC